MSNLWTEVQEWLQTNKIVPFFNLYSKAVFNHNSSAMTRPEKDDVMAEDDEVKTDEDEDSCDEEVMLEDEAIPEIKLSL